MASVSFRKQQMSQALQAVYERQTVTRSALAQLTGLSQASIARLVNRLREQNLIVESRAPGDSSGPGRPTDLLAINPDCGYVIGLEFGPASLIITLVDAVGGVRAWAHEAAPPFVPADETMRGLIAFIDATLRQHGIAWKQVRTVGLALHDVVSTRGEWIMWDAPDAAPYPARQFLERTLGCPVYVEDVSRSFAEAEHRFGAGRGKSDMIYLFIGSPGIGAGIFVNDQLQRSAMGICGEIGHVVVEEDGQLCHCGNRGCLVTVANHEAVINRFRALVGHGVVTSLKGDEPLTFARICKASAAGDKSAYLVLSEIARCIAKALSSAVNITGATFILVGGQLRHAGPGFLTDLSGALRQRVIPALARHIQVEYAALPAHAGAWGVATQALDIAWREGSFILA
jgi:N-acetylglucosamine repressor